MKHDEILQAAKESELYLDGVNQSMPLYVMKTEDLQRFAAIIEKRTIERCAVASWNHYMETCKKHGHGPDVESIRDFCSAAAIRKLGEQE